MAVAEARDAVELVSVDAMQVYRGMDIGTAKPSPAEQARVVHHLVDLVDPSHDFTVAEYQQHFERVRSDMAASRRRGILVGGTGLYHRVVVDRLRIPGQWPEVRAALHAELAAGTRTDAATDTDADSRDGRDDASDVIRSLHERLAALDPVAAGRIEPTNARRVVRALEVCIGGGKPFSSFGPGLDAYPPSDVVQIGLRWDREVLGGRIEARVHSMVAAGFVDEVCRVVAAGMSRTARQALGYRQIIEHLDGHCSLDEAVERTVTHTRQFAVRQLRWFQRDPRVRWVDVVDDPVGEAAGAVAAAIDAP